MTIDTYYSAVSKKTIQMPRNSTVVGSADDAVGRWRNNDDAPANVCLREPSDADEKRERGVEGNGDATKKSERNKERVGAVAANEERAGKRTTEDWNRTNARRTAGLMAITDARTHTHTHIRAAVTRNKYTHTHVHHSTMNSDAGGELHRGRIVRRGHNDFRLFFLLSVGRTVSVVGATITNRWW